MKAKTDAFIEGAVSYINRFAVTGVLLVLFGLVLEIVVAVDTRHGKTVEEAWGPVIGTAFIVVGIVLELTAHQVSRELEGELDRRSAERVAVAEERAAVANERAAQIELEANELRFALAWRRLTMVQRVMLADALKASGPPAMVLFRRMGPDPEVHTFCQDLRFVFHWAGWKTAQSLELNHDQLYGVAVTNDAGPGELVWRVRRAFDKIGLQYEINPLNAGPSFPFLLDWDSAFSQYEKDGQFPDLNRVAVSICVFPKPMTKIELDR